MVNLVYLSILATLSLAILGVLRRERERYKATIILAATFFSAVGAVAEFVNSSRYHDAWIAATESTVLSARDAYYEALLVSDEIPTSDDPAVDSIGVGGEPLSGSVQENAPFAWYTFTAEHEGLHVVETVAPESNEMDTILELFSDRGQLLAENDDIEPGTDLYSRIVRRLDPGIYLVRVRGWRGDTGAYRIQVNRSVESG